MPEHTGFVTRVGPAAGWAMKIAPGVQSLIDESGDIPTRDDLIRLSRVAYRKQLIELLGMILTNTTILVLPGGGGTLGPAIDRHGGIIRWSIWAPHKKLLIDVFRRRLPPTEELEDRKRFADEHELKYGIVAPNEKLELETLKEWLNG